MQMCTKCLEHFASRYSLAYENPTASCQIQLPSTFRSTCIAFRETNTEFPYPSNKFTFPDKFHDFKISFSRIDCEFL